MRHAFARQRRPTRPAGPIRPSTPYLTTIVGRLVRAFDPARIVLVGSRARGDAREDSDYDLFVVLDDVPDKRAARTAIRRALSDLPISKDVVVASVEEAKEGESGWGAVGWVAGEGRTLYERS